MKKLNFALVLLALVLGLTGCKNDVKKCIASFETEEGCFVNFFDDYTWDFVVTDKEDDYTATFTMQKGTYEGDPTKDGELLITMLYELDSDAVKEKIKELVAAGKKQITDKDVPPMIKLDEPSKFKAKINNGILNG